MGMKILIVDDSDFYGKLLIRSIKSKLECDIIWYKTYKETQDAIGELQDVTIALLDYHLPDAMDGEIIDLCSSNKIPCVVMTGTFTSDIQEVIWSKKIIDYVLKEGGHSITYLIELIESFEKNKEIGILIVDDSKVSRSHLKTLLQLHQYKIYEAVNGLQGMEVLEANGDIKLVLTDYQMPLCDGFEFTKKIRKRYPKENLAIIGISSRGGHAMLIKFIKYGANDFITKPFVSELLYCRINQNLNVVEYFEKTRQIALIDHLTSLHNRRYLSETGELLFNSAKRNGTYFAIALIDIDDFKIINDTMGHEMGDIVLKKFADILLNNMRKTDIVCRYGGEEFCIIGNNIDPKEILKLFDSLRIKIFEHTFSFEGKKFNISASFGVCIEKKNSLTDMINTADEKLYEAKKQGKNRVCI